MDFHNKTLLVLGASRYQLPTIEYAKSIGLNVVVIDNVPTNPGHKIADKSFVVDTTDKAAALQIAQQENVDVVIAPCTDVAVATAAYVNERLDIDYVPLSSAEILTSKILFREFQRDNNIPHPEFFQVDDADEIANKLDFSKSWVIKPDKSSGSKGIYIIDSEKQFHERYPESKSHSLNDLVSIEECIDGHHGTAEGVIRDGVITDIFFLDRQTAKPPHVCTTGHLIPSRLSSEIKTQIQTCIEQLWTRLHIDNAVFDVDYIWDGEQLLILEASPRLGGNSISQLISLASNVNMLEKAIYSLFGMEANDKTQLSNKVSPAAVVLLGVDVSCRVEIDYELTSKLTEEDGIHSIDLHIANGDKVQAFSNGRHCLATVFLTEQKYDQLMSRVAYIRSAPIFKIV